MSWRTPPRRPAVAGLCALALVVGVAGCTTSDPGTATLDQGDGYRQVSTSRTVPSKQALDDVNRELDAARTTVTQAPSTTNTPSPPTSSEPSSSSTLTIESTPPSSEGPPAPPSSEAAPPLTPADCRQFQQLVTFVDQVKDLIDPNDPGGTADRLAPPVQQSKGGFDQLLSTAITEMQEPVTVVITWLRARASAKEADDEAGLTATTTVEDFVKANCR